MDTHRIARIGGWTAVAAGVLGAGAGLLLIVVPPQVTAGVFSYPFTATGHAVIQSVLCLQHLGMAFALVMFWRAGLAGSGRFAAFAAWISVAVTVMFALQELVAITAADAPYPSPQTDIIDGMYGILSLLLGVTLVLYGIAAVRAGALTGPGRWALLIFGAYVFIPTLPAVFLGGFIVGRVTLAVWMLIFSWWGVVMIRWADAGARAGGGDVRPHARRRTASVG